MKELFRIFSAFFRVGAFTFGGGYAMIPILRREVLEKYGWVTEEEMMDYYALSQSIPGIIAVNTSSFIGRKIRKIPGMIAAALGVIMPSLIIIVIIAAVLQNFLDNTYVQHALQGIQIVVFALICDAVWKMRDKAMKTVVGWIVFVIVFGLNVSSVIWTNPVLKTVTNPIYIVLATVVAGVVLGACNAIKEDKL